MARAPPQPGGSLGRQDPACHSWSWAAEEPQPLIHPPSWKELLHSLSTHFSYRKVMPFPASSFQGDSSWESTGSAGAGRNQPAHHQPRGSLCPSLCPTHQGTEGPLAAAPAHLCCPASLCWAQKMLLWDLTLSQVPPGGHRASLLRGIRAGEGCVLVVQHWGHGGSGAAVPLPPLPWGGCPQEALGHGCWDGGAQPSLGNVPSATGSCNFHSSSQHPSLAEISRREYPRLP